MMRLAGKGAKSFFIKKPKETIASTGRPKQGGYEDGGVFQGILSMATQKEIERWKQSGHPITCTIIQPMPQEIRARANDVLVVGERSFFIQGAVDPGEIGHFMVYYCEERGDLSWQI